MTLFRPTAMRQEVVPHLIEEAVEAEQANRKRNADEATDQPEHKAPRLDASPDSPDEHPIAYVESACCDTAKSHELWQTFQTAKNNAVEALVA